MRPFARTAALWLALALSTPPLAARAQDPAPPTAAPDAPSAPPPAGPGTPAAEAGGGPFAVHLQSTLVDQANGRFRSPYAGPNSLTSTAKGRETFDLTLYAGVRLWTGAEVWINPEIDQGFGLDDTLGVAGFPSGEAYKLGFKTPYLQLHRFFFRQTVDLGGEKTPQEADLNQFAAAPAADRLVLTVGKISVPDIFDANKYAHDPRGDFLNWTIIDAGTFDYAADSWGFAAGAVAELYKGRFTGRLGSFLMSNIPNSPNLDLHFSQFQTIGEIEARHTLLGRDGVVRVTAYLSRARMGRLLDAIRLAERQGGVPDPALVRRYASRPGVSLDLEQTLAKDLGAFLRAGVADGRYEAFEFTDVDRSISAGLSLNGARWARADDIVGLALVINQASKDRQAYLADGGLGILIGDGRLPRPGPETTLETYYLYRLAPPVSLSLDAQLVDNPGYNRDRGPVGILGLRIHGQL